MEQLGLGCNKLRRIMIRPGRDRLRGVVEVDETYVGGVEEGIKGRKIENKVLVAVAVEEVEGKIGRVRFRCIPNASANHLIPFIEDNVEPGSVVKTDGWKGYVSVSEKGYEHVIHKISRSNKKASELMPSVSLVIALVKRWLLGTHQGGIGSDYLQYYLDEFAFRFNRRLSTHRGKLFYRLMQQAVNTEATPLKSIIQSKEIF